ncbi:MAG TPA: hydroxyisourate hydrolase [Gammaproteobacteria bacterium]|nr:hydroxyisourate hydrolase [Gammaproteobacteria bacterium]
MGRLTTHVLDTANGRPGSGIRVTVRRVTERGPVELKTVVTNSDGRCDAPLLADEAFEAGVYELEFAVGAYFGEVPPADGPRFLDDIVLRFGVANADQHYHVPLLVSPYSYTTYRGS